MRLILICFSFLLFISSSCEKQEDDTYSPRNSEQQSRSTKRGVSFNFQFADDITALSSGVSWSYNWGTGHNNAYNPIFAAEEMDYCPMAWNGVNESALREYVNTHPNCKYLLAYNEPNLTDQANMTPQQAAQKWGSLKSIANELGLKVISPAMNYGTLAGYSDPIVWLDEFFSLVPLSDVDGIAIHCYMSSPGAVKWFVERFAKYNKPIWLTEFCAWDGLNENNFNAEGQQKYMSDVINYLESEPMIFRYAWFIPRGNGSEANFPYMFLLKNTSNVELTALGKIYTQLSTQDKDTYFVEQQTIEAEHYSSISIQEGVGTEGWVNGPRVRVTSESPNETLELFNFLPTQWVEYQIELDRTKEFLLEIRYASFMDAEITITIDGENATNYVLESTQEEYVWNTAQIAINATKGKHTFRITLNKGTCCMNWLRIK